MNRNELQLFYFIKEVGCKYNPDLNILFVPEFALRMSRYKMPEEKFKRKTALRIATISEVNRAVMYYGNINSPCSVDVATQSTKGHETFSLRHSLCESHA